MYELSITNIAVQSLTITLCCIKYIESKEDLCRIKHHYQFT